MDSLFRVLAALWLIVVAFSFVYFLVKYMSWDVIRAVAISAAIIGVVYGTLYAISIVF